MPDLEYVVAAERRQVQRTARSQPVANRTAARAFVERFVDDDVRGTGLPQRLPCAVRPVERVLEAEGQRVVLLRRAAAVAIDEPLPVSRRVEHVADVEGGLAERQLEENRSVGQPRNVCVQLVRVVNR